jgi:hypothetical protein
VGLLAEQFRLPNMKTQYAVTVDQPIEEALRADPVDPNSVLRWGSLRLKERRLGYVTPVLPYAANMNIPQFTADGPDPYEVPHACHPEIGEKSTRDAQGGSQSSAAISVTPSPEENRRRGVANTGNALHRLPLWQ